MKKVLLFVSMFLLTISVSASTQSKESKIGIENIKVELKENIGYNDEVTFKYSINPIDATNTNLSWEIKKVNGVNVTFVESKTTESTGEVTFNVENTTKKSVDLTLYAKQNGKVVSTNKFTVEAKDETLERVTKEVTDAINALDEEITNDNYEEVKETIAEIEKELQDEELKSAISEELLTKYENVKAASDEFTPKSNTLIAIITVALVIIFTGLLFWIFNKED